MPRLTVSILTLNGAERLPAVLDAVEPFADEIVVGVDAASDDDSEAVALSGADRVFRFSHVGELSSARMRIFDLATGDWILVVDDDEALEPGFGRILRDLMSTPVVTHAWFPRKWVVALDPAAHLYAPRWYPDWQLRLFRNDRTLVRKPPRPHSGYHVSGPGLFEPRVAILHFEPLWTGAEERRAKIERYRACGARGDWESQYAVTDAIPCRPCVIPTSPASRRARRFGPGTLAPAPLGGTRLDDDWRFEVLSADPMCATSSGAEVIATVSVRNLGCLAWWPEWGLRSPRLFFTYHLLAADGGVLAWDCERSAIPGPVAPGMDVTFFHAFRAPEDTGDYLLDWAMVSEGDRWFERMDSVDPIRSVLRVVSDVTSGRVVN